MEKQKTAVDWLMENISYDNGYGGRNNSFTECFDLSDFFKKAKEMEKEQIEKSFDEGGLQCNINELPEKSRKHFKTANDYFDFTYTQSSE